MSVINFFLCIPGNAVFQKQELYVSFKFGNKGYRISFVECQLVKSGN